MSVPPDEPGVGNPPVLSKAVRLRCRHSRADAQNKNKKKKEQRRFSQSADPSVCAARRFLPGIESKCRKERARKLVEEPRLSLSTAIESTDICMQSMWSALALYCEGLVDASARSPSITRDSRPKTGWETGDPAETRGTRGDLPQFPG